MDDRIRAARRILGLVAIVVILILALAHTFTDLTVSQARIQQLIALALALLAIDPVSAALAGGDWSFTVDRKEKDE